MKFQLMLYAIEQSWNYYKSISRITVEMFLVAAKNYGYCDALRYIKKKNTNSQNMHRSRQKLWTCIALCYLTNK